MAENKLNSLNTYQEIKNYWTTNRILSDFKDSFNELDNCKYKNLYVIKDLIKNIEEKIKIGELNDTNDISYIKYYFDSIDINNNKYMECIEKEEIT